MKNPKKHEIRKPSKTLAGVTPIAVMLKPRKCKHGTCIYCPSLNVPQSYTPLSPAVMRAKMLNYNAYKQVRARLKAFKAMNHPTDKIELIIMGGTFLDYPLYYQYNFIKQCYDALNGKKSKNLEQAKKLNEKARHRCVALCIETRPDVCGKKEIRRMLEFGCTRVELGVQAIDNKIYKKVNRGHAIKHVIEATRLLKDSGFKVLYHLMPGIPGSNPKKDVNMFKKIFSDERFKPDGLKIYPCQVIKGSRLERLYMQLRYKPYTKQETKRLLIKMLKIIPEYCRVMRIMREIPPAYLIAGTKRIDLRREIENELRKQKAKIKEIRFREIGFASIENKGKNKSIDTNIKIKITEYRASKGKEFFIQAVNKDNILFGLLRARFPCQPFLPELKNAVIVRELHVYGKALKIGKRMVGGIQHAGIGKTLLKKAEMLARKVGYRKLAVISGVGVRQYYKKQGYKLEGSYMVKEL